MKPNETMVKLEKVVLATVLVPLLAVTPAVSAAQAAAQDIGGLRAYWHVFIAYSIVIVLVLGWVISIGRRLREVEERIGE